MVYKSMHLVGESFAVTTMKLEDKNYCVAIRDREISGKQLNVFMVCHINRIEFKPENKNGCGCIVRRATEKFRKCHTWNHPEHGSMVFPTNE